MGPLGLGVLATVLVSFGVSAQPAIPHADAGSITHVDGGTAASASTQPSASGATANSAAPASSSSGTTVPAADAPPVAPAQRKRPTPLTPPSSAQVAAYEAYRAQVDTYERSARDYREALTGIITLHYERKKHTVLSGFDKEITIEKAELKKAREAAIRKLEAFVDKYSGLNAQPEATPDAMYRLAALYEERGRETDEELRISLKPAIALYKRIIKDFAQYREIAGVYYFLGHALADAARSPEAQQVWRSLVCQNHFAYPVAVDAKDPEVDQVTPLPQDDTHEHWAAWRRKYTRPESLRSGGSEVAFVNPYPDDCKPIAQVLKTGETPRYVSEIWWRIGEWETEQEDLGGGVVALEPFAVWDFNRGVVAYKHSMHTRKPPFYAISLYKYAFTLFKQQRYEASTREFVNLLNYTDEQEKLTGDKGTDFRLEAYRYIAGSLTNLDFVGPGPDEPFIPREDVFTSGQAPALAEQKLRIGIDRVQDPQLIPQDRKWTIDVYRQLAIEYGELGHERSAITIYEKMLEKWPMDSTAPETQAKIAEMYQSLAGKLPIGEERQRYEGEVLKARTALAKYVGDMPWPDANKDNPAALQRAEELAKSGLRTAAVTHTNNGWARFEEAKASRGDPPRQLQLLSQAQREFELAALGWVGYLKQEEGASDAYESRYFYAEALHQQVRIKLTLHTANSRQFAPPSAKEIDTAKRAALDVRESNEDDKYLDNAALFVVDLSDVPRDLAFERNKESGGSQGIAPRTEPRKDAQRKVIKDPVPDEIQGGINARDEYVQRVPTQFDKDARAPGYQFYGGEQLLFYGHFTEARPRFEQLWKEHCGKDELGYEAWKRLWRMSTMENDIDRSNELAKAEKAHSCAFSDVQVHETPGITDKTIKNIAYLKAREEFKKAETMPPGPARDAQWKKAAEMYEAALKADPGHDDAHEAAFNAALAYRRIGQMGKAIELYQLFIDKYGSEENLKRLQNGDAASKDKYAIRVKNLGDAYEALAETNYGFFNYRQAAESYGSIANNGRFNDDKRKRASLNALSLYKSLGDRPNVEAQYKLLQSPKMNLEADRKLDIDFRRADFDYNQWNPTGEIGGRNGDVRKSSVASLTQYYNANKANAKAAQFAIEASYKVAKMLRTVGDPGYRQWLRNTIAAWQFFSKNPTVDDKGKPLTAAQAPFNEYGAESEFILLDEEVQNEWDNRVVKYQGTVDEVKKKYDEDADTVERKYRPRFDAVITTYQAFESTPNSMARLGTLYDKLRSQLELVIPKYFSAKDEKLLEALEAKGQQEKADKIRDGVRGAWRAAKDARIDVATQSMVTRYTQAAVYAREKNVKSAHVQKGVARLAFYSDYMGDEKMRKYVERVQHPFEKRPMTYQNGMFLQWRAGLVTRPKPSGEALALPVAP